MYCAVCTNLPLPQAEGRYLGTKQIPAPTTGSVACIRDPLLVGREATQGTTTAGLSRDHETSRE